MKLDTPINHDGKTPSEMFYITEERFEQTNAFIDKIIEDAKNGNVLQRSIALEKIIEFSETNVEAVLIFAFYEQRLKAEIPDPISICHRQFEKNIGIGKVNFSTK